MKFRYVSAVVVLAALMPFAASALSISDLQQQITNLLAQIAQLQGEPSTQSSQGTSAMPARICPQIIRTLSRGAHGDDVASLQAYLGVSQTGYFGPLTASAVAQFQASEGLSQVGNVGPLTRAALARRCGNPNPPVCTMMARLCPAGYHNGGWCNLDCIPDSTSVSTPTISGLDAPTSLSVGASGTWTVHASSPNQPGAQLRYSVVWGDENIYPMPMMSAAASPTVQTSATFTHAYSEAGVYTPTFTVGNDAGSAQTSATIAVGGTSQKTFSASPTSGVAPLIVNFRAMVSIYGSGYVVDFGDGTNGLLQTFVTLQACQSGGNCVQGSASHTYIQAGTYTARLAPSLCDLGLGSGCPARPNLILGTATITVRIATSSQTMTKTVGEREGSFLIQRINTDSVDGLWYQAYPVATNQGSPRTLHIGDDIGYACEGVSEKLTSIDYYGQKVTFTKVVGPPPYGGCPI